MKRLLSVVAIYFSLMGTGQAQTHWLHIVHVSGEITNLKNGQALKQGQKIYPTDKLQFLNKQSRAIAISSERGRFVIAPPVNTSENELIFYVKNSIIP